MSEEEEEEGEPPGSIVGMCALLGAAMHAYVQCLPSIACQGLDVVTAGDLVRAEIKKGGNDDR